MTREQKGLRFAAGVAMAFGLLTALGAWPPTAAPTVFLADLLVWPLDGAETGASPEARLLFAISGGVLAGWGLLIWSVAGDLHSRDPGFARRIIRQSVLVWFAIDSTGSVLAGAPVNVLPNLVFLALFLLPMRQRLAPQAAP